MLIAATAAALAVVALGFTLIYRTSVSQELRRQTTVNCMQIEDLKNAITNVLRDARYASTSRAGLSPSELSAIRAYYAKQLARFAPQECPSS